MHFSPALVWIDVCMHVYFSEVGHSPITEMSHSDPQARPPSLDLSTQLWWTQCFAKNEHPGVKNKQTNVHTHKKTKLKNRGVLDPQETEDNSFPDRSCFIVHVCVVLHLHIEGVLSKWALAGDGWVQRSRGWQRSKRSKDSSHIFGHFVLAVESSIGHQMISSPWPEVTQDCSTAWDHLLITCIFTHKNVLLLFVHTPFFPLLFFLLFLCIFGRFVVSKWPVKPK